jgi:hypothetical protein
MRRSSAILAWSWTTIWGASRLVNVGIDAQAIGGLSSRRPSAKPLVYPPPQNLQIRGFNVLFLEQFQFQFAGFLLNSNIGIREVVGNGSQECGPRSSHHIFAIIITAENDDLTPFASGARSKINGNTVATPVASKRDPARVSIHLLDSTRRLRVLAI